MKLNKLNKLQAIVMELTKLEIHLGVVLGEERQASYAEVLQHVEVEAVERACRLAKLRFTPYGQHNFPSVAELLSYINEASLYDKAVLAWAKLRRFGHPTKAYDETALDDPLTKECFEAMGGKPKGNFAHGFGGWPNSQEPQKRKEFLELYQAKAKDIRVNPTLTIEDLKSMESQLGNIIPYQEKI